MHLCLQYVYTSDYWKGIVSGSTNSVIILLEILNYIDDQSNPSAVLFMRI